MSFKSAIRLASALAAIGALSVPATALATSGQWDTAAAGYGGNGATSATPWITTPADGSSLAEWNFFNGTSDSAPDIAGSGTLVETTGAAFVTGGGNIYSFAAPTAFTATLAGLVSGTWDIYLRIATLGTTANEVATLNGLTASRTVTYTEAISGGFGGGEEESLWHWSLVPGASTFTFNFSASGSSLSLDQVALYAVPVPVPEPGALGLLAAGLGAAALLGRRRRQP